MRCVNKCVVVVIFLFLSIRVICQTIELIDFPFNKGSYYSGVSDSNFLYCMSDFGIHIWDITNVEKPLLVSSMSLTGFCYDGKIDKYLDNLFILKNNKLFISNVKNVADYEIIDLKLSESSIDDFAIIDSFLVVSSYGFNGVNVYKIKNDTIDYYSNFSNGGGSFRVFKNKISFLFYDIVIMTEFVNGQIETLDTLKFPHSISSFIANDSILCVSYVEISDGYIPNYSYVVDISNNTHEVLDSISLPVYCNYDFITDSKLVIKNSSNSSLYCINKQNLNRIGDFNPYYITNTCLVNDSIISAFNGSDGFSFYKFSCKGINLIHKEKCSDWITGFHKSVDDIVYESNDSLYFTNKQQGFSLKKEGVIKIEDSLLFEYTESPYQIKYSIIKDQKKNFIFSFPADNNYMIYFKKFGNYIYHYMNGIYDVTDLNQPIVLSDDCGYDFDFKTTYNNYLISHDSYLHTFKLYAENMGNPVLVREYQLSPPDVAESWYAFRYNSIENRAYGFATSDGYFYLDYSNLDSVHYTKARRQTGMTNHAGRIRDSINWVISNIFIYAEDVSDIYHLRTIKRIQFNNLPQTLFFENDTTLLISFGGYVTRYRISGFKAGEVQTWTKLADVVAVNSDLFPNPNKGNFSVQVKDDFIKTVRIINVNGQLVYVKNCESKNDHIEINVSFQTGSYTVFIVGQKGNYIKKMIIE